MADNKKYYWLRLHRDFFKRHDIQVIESMENGKDYVLFYMKLLVESIDHEGRLRFSETIPYNEQMLSTITHTNVDVVRSALKIFEELEMITVLDDQTLYMEKVAEMIGSSSTDDPVARENHRLRQQRYRERQKLLSIDEASRDDNVTVTRDGEKEIEKEIEIDIEKDTNKSTKVDCQAVVDKFNSICISFPKVSKVSDKRTKAIKSILKEYTLDELTTVFEKTEASDFMKTGTWCSFDWLMNKNNLIKVIEGNYDNRGNKNGKSEDDIPAIEYKSYKFW